MSFSKRLEQARQAFRTGDIESSALAHSPQQIAQAAQERHGGASSQYIGDMVYGGLDGIVTTFAVVSGVAGAQLVSNIILIMGLANLFADGFSMAVGAYLSTKSEQEYYQRERLRETWEVEHFPDSERSELLEVYRSRGYSEEDAQGLVDIQARDTDRWVDAMMIDELGMLLDDRKPVLSALATFTAFAIAGSTPLIVYIPWDCSPIHWQEVPFLSLWDYPGWLCSHWVLSKYWSQNVILSSAVWKCCWWAGWQPG